MLILGILLIVVALVVFGYMLLGTRDLDALQIDLGAFNVELTPLLLFLVGAATLAVLALGLLALAAGLRASRRRRQEVKDLRKAVRSGGADYDRRDRDERVVTDPVSDRGRSVTPPASQPASATAAPYEQAPSTDYPTRQTTRDEDPEIAIPSDYKGGSTTETGGTNPDATPRNDGDFRV